MGYGVQEIEDLVLAAVEAAPLNTYVKTFERYDGQFNVDDVNKVKSTFPAVFVAWGRDTFVEQTPGVTFVDEMSITVVVAAKSLRGDHDSKLGSAGVYKMLDDVKNILHKNALGKADVFGLFLRSRRRLIDIPGLAVFALDFTLKFRD